MKKTLLYIFAAALASVFTLQSCGLEEPFPGPQSGISEGSVEFVVRPVSFNDHDVATKADGDPATFEDDEIHNAYLLVFDAYGQRLLCEEISLNTEAGGLTAEYDQLSAKIDRALGTVTVCVLANVPKSFAEGIIGTTNPGGASANLYLDTAVLDLTYSDASKVGTVMGIPAVDLDSNSQTPSVPCIPMFGQLPTPIDLSSAPSINQIELKRLFAKVTIKLSLQMDLQADGWQQIVNSSSYFELGYCNLNNMPTKVSLMESGSDQSAWYNTSSAFKQVAGGPKNIRIYNNRNLIEFYFYVPEYYLKPKTGASDNQKEKPINFQTGTYPIYLSLVATYSQYSLNSTNLTYKVYLGRNEHSDFSVERNVNYINSLAILGISNYYGEGAVEIDHRVTTSVINNPVAKEGKSANCYIIGETGEYSFPAYKGAYNELTDAALCQGDAESQLVELDKDNSSIQLSGLSYDPDLNMVSFNVDQIADGNVVIALQNGDGSIEWSWHLWCNTSSRWEQTLGWATMENHTYPNNAVMMDRNLGASSTSGAGTYYIYGSKNPFIKGRYLGGGSNGDATWYVEDEYIGTDGNLVKKTVKAVNDPCPPGYYVPSSTVWKGFTPTKENADNQNAFIYWKENTGDINLLDDIYVYYPYAGYLENGTGQSSGTVTVPLEYNDELLYETNLFNVYRAYKDIKYTINVTSTFGMLCGSDEALRYDVSTTDSGSWLTSDFTVTAVTWYKGTRKKVGGSLWNPVYEITYDYNRPYTLADITGTEQANWITAKSTVIDPKLKEATKAYSYAAVDFPAINSSYGYQVRCVKE